MRWKPTANPATTCIWRRTPNHRPSRTKFGDMFLGDNAHNVVVMKNAISLDDDRHERALRHIRSSVAINHTRLLGNCRSIRRASVAGRMDRFRKMPGGALTGQGRRPRKLRSNERRPEVSQIHTVDAKGAVVARKLKRGATLAFFSTLPPCEVAMEASLQRVEVSPDAEPHEFYSIKLCHAAEQSPPQRGRASAAASARSKLVTEHDGEDCRTWSSLGRRGLPRRNEYAPKRDPYGTMCEPSDRADELGIRRKVPLDANLDFGKSVDY